MSAPANLAFFLTLLVAACSPPAEESPSNGGGTGNAPASGGAAGTATTGGSSTGGVSGTSGAAGSAVNTGGTGGSGAGAPSGGTGAGGVGVSGASGAPSGGLGGAGDGGGSGSPSGGLGGAGDGGSSNGGAPNGGTAGNGMSGAPSSGTGGRGGGGAGAAGGTGTGGAFGVCNGPAPARAVTIYVVGDSTASVYASNLAPRMGWGQPLQDLFAMQCAVVQDKALSGRSSKSFIDEGAWTPIKNALANGDVVLIQFGHNDEKDDDPTRYTEPQTTFKQYLTTYINDTRAKQATPVLLTPINRNNWSGTTLSNTHGTYPDAMRQLATSLSVGLIDMTALTKTYFERIGQAATADLFLILAAGESPNYPSGVTDNTHFQEAGARKLGQIVTYDAYRQRLPFAAYLKAVPVAP